jgi:hypothetical protein
VRPFETSGFGVACSSSLLLSLTHPSHPPPHTPSRHHTATTSSTTPPPTRSSPGPRTAAGE